MAGGALLILDRTAAGEEVAAVRLATGGMLVPDAVSSVLEFGLSWLLWNEPRSGRPT